PQIYYVGLLAGSNDVELLRRTGVGRDINRHYYSHDELLASLRRPVVAKLCQLIRLRNAHAAFAGTFRVADSSDTELVLRWHNGAEFAELVLDFGADRHRLVVSEDGAVREIELSGCEETEPARDAPSAAR
ncbi:MAG TPA: sucrose phosphorylase, partial [Gammaproteobacteria bacterium]|nr:sucrose phosphorylase [Gammaproteobacteria bacterium]